jgi:hypothetical protein
MSSTAWSPPDATYVSLNTENAELSKIMPWTGTSRGPHAFLDNLGRIFTRWETQAFNVNTMFASDENVAVFGDFRYRSNSRVSLGPPCRRNQPERIGQPTVPVIALTR